MRLPPSDLPKTNDAEPWLFLVGPTASGKSSAAMAIAAAFARDRPVEIVSVDSALVYRGMDIGTAKPRAAERAAVPHHLIDVIEPSERYSAARFVIDAGRAIEGIRERNRLPLLVGGTMLYFKVLIDGLDAMPAADPAIRAALEREAEQRGWPALHAELSRVDPVTAARLSPHDGQRIQRALEVHRLSGRPMVSFHGTLPTRRSKPAPPMISLEPADRDWLHRRIGRRFEAMLAEGLVDEVRRLRSRGDLDAGLPSMRCVGYRQTWEALDRDELDRLSERGAAATRQLAKRQLTWLRSWPQRHVVRCDGPDALDDVIAAAKRLSA